MTKFAGLGMKLRRRDQLLAQIGGRIDQEPVLAAGAESDRGLRALKLGMLAACFQAHRTSAIPLRNPATCRGAQDDDAKHDPSPGDSVTSERYLKLQTPQGGHRHKT